VGSPRVGMDCRAALIAFEPPFHLVLPTLLNGAVSQIEIYCNEQMCTAIRRILLVL